MGNVPSSEDDEVDEDKIRKREIAIKNIRTEQRIRKLKRRNIISEIITGFSNKFPKDIIGNIVSFISFRIPISKPSILEIRRTFCGDYNYDSTKKNINNIINELEYIKNHE